MEDEKIRKWLIGYFHQYIVDGMPTVFSNGLNVKDVIAWLEKQGKDKKAEDKYECPNINLKDAIEVTSRIKLIDDDLIPIADFIMDYANWNLHKDEWGAPTLEVPLFRVLDALILKGEPYGEDKKNE